MATTFTYGINFPFRDSLDGKYLSTSKTTDEEIRTNLIHLILTRKGSRYFLPNFGTRLYEFIFEPLDGPTFDAIKADIRESVSNFIPNLSINNISITPFLDDNEVQGDINTENLNNSVLRVAGRGTEEYTAKVRIDFTIQNGTFDTRDFIILNI
jgi:phage baseplate assembly protein W